MRIVLLLWCWLAIAVGHAQSSPAAPAGHVAAHAAPAYSLPPAKLERAKALDRQGNWLWAASTLWGVVSLLVVLRLHWAARLSRWAARASRRGWVQGLIFVPLLVILLRLLHLPIAIFGHHLGLAYGLSVEHWPAWFWDWTKGLLVSVVTGTLVLSLLFAIVRHSPRRWWLWFWLLSLPLMLAAVYVEPLIIDPLFNKFEPLSRSHPELVAQMEQVVTRSGEHIPPDRMFLMKASEKVTGLNAYVTGFGGSKRVVVWDTSLQKSTPDEVLFIFGHELGHYVLGDVVHGLMMGAAGLLVALWMGFHAVRWMVRRYGAAWGVPAVEDWSAVVVLMLAFAVFSFVSDPIANAISRHIEHRADVYGQEVVHGIVPDPQVTAVHSFQTLGEESLDLPDPNRWMVLWTYSHPPIADRADFARDYNPWRPDARPRFFPK
ncbi:MAG: Zn-dependent protease with chaperone function [Acidobacteriaceae bacterium]|nr:Zn-dependent protease with chaperone function [Acidobacteriaceae bacterium]